MSRWLLFFLCCAVSSGTVGQEFISLRAVPFKASTKESIYIESVLDERNIKNLGEHQNLNGDGVVLALWSGMEESVAHFYRLSFPKESTSRPIVIKIRNLNVQESKRRMDDGIARAARTHVEMAFCIREEGALKEIYSIKHNEDEVFDLFNKPGLYATHEKRIRAALEYCMQAFLLNYQKRKPKISETSVETYKENQSLNANLGQWFNLFTLKGMQSRYFQGYGISYTGFVDSKNGWIKPYETSFEITWAKDDIAAENGFSEVNSFVFRPELYFFYKRLLSGVYASMSVNAPFGFELLEDMEGANSFNFVIGAGASQGLRFIPWQQKGIVFGVDFFQQLETSKVYSFDYGIEVVLGMNF